LLGVETMAQLRFGRPPEDFTPYQRKNFLNGPGKLCQALALTRAENGADLTSGQGLWVSDDGAELGISLPEQSPLILATPRIGIDYAQEAVHFPWRFIYHSKGGAE